MSRRKTVMLNLDLIGPLIKNRCRSYTVFCERMGRANNWVTDWLRKDEFGKPAYKNLPSPEEAARMCVILQVRPEEILTEPEDIELVTQLLESQKQKPTPEGEPLALHTMDDWKEALTGLSQDELKQIVAMAMEQFMEGEK